MEPGSPFGERIAALVTTLRYSHGISYARMTQMLTEVFGLKMSQGAIDNLLSRVKRQLDLEVDGILATLRRAKPMCSDETSARVNGKNQCERWPGESSPAHFLGNGSFRISRCVFISFVLLEGQMSLRR
jgi:transposase